MSPKSLRVKPLRILAVFTEGDEHGPGLFSALAAHYTLVCRSARQALDSAPRFDPEVVLIDAGLPGRDTLVEGLSESAGTGERVFVELTDPESAGEVSAGFHHRLAVPVTASDVEGLLWRIHQDSVDALTSAWTSS
jgi:hypothetical protein